MTEIQAQLVELVAMLDGCKELDTVPIWRQVYKAQQAITEASRIFFVAKSRKEVEKGKNI